MSMILFYVDDGDDMAELFVGIVANGHNFST